MVDGTWVRRSLRGVPGIDVARGLVNARRGTRRLLEAAISQPSVRVSVGAGDVELPGWLNTDLHAHYHLDLLKPWPISGVAYVYGDNVIEHFCLQDVRRVLAHMHDALRPGGIVRLVTPDVERSAQIYLGGGDACRKVMDRHRAAGYKDIDYPADVLRVVFATSGHHEGYLFDFLSLTSELCRAGFVGVTRYEVGDSGDPVLSGLEKRTQPADVMTTLVVEARRSARAS